MEDWVKKLIENANKGDVESLVMVGDFYNRGQYLEQDIVKALRYYKAAADRGSAPAMFMVSLGYISGQGVEMNKKLGQKYMQKSADCGFAEAQFMFGNYCNDGFFGFLLKRKAGDYLEMAAKQGHAKAQVALADMYLTGKGRPYSIDKGMVWLLCAYMHGRDAYEDSTEAKDRINFLLRNNSFPGGRKRTDEMIAEIQRKAPNVIRNPEHKSF